MGLPGVRAVRSWPKKKTEMMGCVFCWVRWLWAWLLRSKLWVGAAACCDISFVFAGGPPCVRQGVRMLRGACRVGPAAHKVMLFVRAVCEAEQGRGTGSNSVSCCRRPLSAPPPAPAASFALLFAARRSRRHVCLFFVVFMAGGAGGGRANSGGAAASGRNASSVGGLGVWCVRRTGRETS